MSNCHTRIINSLFTGPKTSAQLRAVGGKSYATRIYEIKKAFGGIDITYSKLTKMYTMSLVRSITIDMTKVYPNRRAA